MNQPPLNDLEELFNRQPPYDESALARVIAHYREARASYAAGNKPSKTTGPKSAAVDLADLGLAAPKAEVKPLLLGGRK